MSKYYDKMWGIRVSDYALENGRCDYRTLAKAFGSVPFTPPDSMWERLELVNGNDMDKYDDPVEIFEYLFIEKQLYEVLSMETNEIVYYDPELDVYVWGITHWGTSWDYVLTDIPLVQLEE